MLTNSQTQEELLNTAFHDLRTPISSINGYASILLSGELGKLSPKQLESVKRIQELCQASSDLISNLLTLSKAGLQRTQKGREFVHVAQVGEEVLRSLQGEVRRKKLRLLTHLPKEDLRFWSDPSDLTQIFLNLLSNAVKFTPPGGRVEVAVGAKSDLLSIEVADSGVGIPTREISKIFDEFYHVDHPETGAPRGSGLGLAIVKKVVEAYRGKVTVESTEGKGSRFLVTLPIQPERRILEQFLTDSATQAKESGRSLGLILFQVKAADGKSTRLISRRQMNPAGFIEKAMRENLRKEDRIFYLTERSLLAVMMMIDSKGFSEVLGRLKGILQNSKEFQKLMDTRRSQWRLAAVLSPRRGEFPADFLRAAQQRLREAWERQVEE